MPLNHFPHVFEPTRSAIDAENRIQYSPIVSTRRASLG
jgi:hypothetical protein